MARRYIGHVACDPHPQSPYVRVSCPPDNLSMKAGLNGHRKRDIQKGDVVEVEETFGGYKGWKVVRVLKEVTVEEAVKRQATAEITVEVRINEGERRDTYRYIRVKFPETTKLYTYRCDFMVRDGDVLIVPTCYGDKVATVRGETSADQEWRFPTAKWAKCFKDRRMEEHAWPKHFRVRHKDHPDRVLYANQTKVCWPGEEPSHDHMMVAVALSEVQEGDVVFHGKEIDAVFVDEAYILGVDYGEIERTVIASMALPGWVLEGMDATKQAALMRAYGAGDRKMIEFLEERREALKAELEAVDNAIDEAKMRERLAEIERTLEREREADAYRKKFDGVEVDKNLVEEAVKLRDRLKYGADEGEKTEGEG